jgi:hypothetical protein
MSSFNFFVKFFYVVICYVIRFELTEAVLR